MHWLSDRHLLVVNGSPQTSLLWNSVETRNALEQLNCKLANNFETLSKNWAQSYGFEDFNSHNKRPIRCGMWRSRMENSGVIELLHKHYSELSRNIFMGLVIFCYPCLLYVPGMFNSVENACSLIFIVTSISSTGGRGGAQQLQVFACTSLADDFLFLPPFVCCQFSLLYFCCYTFNF